MTAFTLIQNIMQDHRNIANHVYLLAKLVETHLMIVPAVIPLEVIELLIKTNVTVKLIMKNIKTVLFV